MFDTHAIARSLTDAGIEPAQADAITNAVRQAAEHDNAAEPLATARDLADGLAAVRTDLAELRTEIAAVESRIAWRVIGALVAVASIQTAIVIAILRMLGSS